MVFSFFFMLINNYYLGIKMRFWIKAGTERRNRIDLLKYGTKRPFLHKLQNFLQKILR
jgi:hypothetical protein